MRLTKNFFFKSGRVVATAYSGGGHSDCARAQHAAGNLDNRHVEIVRALAY